MSVEISTKDGFRSFIERVLRHQRAERHEAALALIAQAGDVEEARAVLSHLKGLSLVATGKREDGLAAIQEAMDVDPDNGGYVTDMGAMLAQAGRIDEAAEHLLKAASLMPAGTGALTRLIQLRKTKEDSPEFTILTRILDDRMDRFGPQRQASLHMAAGKAYADLGDFKASFDHLLEGNAITAARHSFDLENHIAQADRMIDVVTPALVSDLRSQAGLDDIAPVFVCGMPRSGTTLMEQMLSRHSRVQAGGELNASFVAFGQVQRLVDILEERNDGQISADDINLIAEGYVAALLAQGIESETITDKLPINYMYVGLLALAFPRARFVIMRRHPMDCCLSNWTQDFGRNQPFSSDFQKLGQVYSQFRRMAEHWATLLPEQVRIVDYEEVIAAVEPTMQGVLSFCDLPWQADVLDHVGLSQPVNTASIGQVRQPLYRGSIGKWRSYGALLRPLAEEVAEFLDPADREAAGLPRLS